MHILLTNDDGVTSPGLLALVQAMRELGDVSILAPDRNWSSCGHSKSLTRPLRVNETTLADGTAALCSDGAPSDCVALALLGIIDKPIDLVVSGINQGANLGDDVTYSGTVAAAMEAVIMRTPAVAVSQDIQHEFSAGYTLAARVAQQVVRRVIEQPLPEGVLLNVNLPHLQEDESFKGIRTVRQGKRVYNSRLDIGHDPRGQKYYWISGDKPGGVPTEGTDVGAIAQGYAAVTPLHMDLTANDLLSDWTWDA